MRAPACQDPQPEVVANWSVHGAVIHQYGGRLGRLGGEIHGLGHAKLSKVPSGHEATSSC